MVSTWIVLASVISFAFTFCQGQPQHAAFYAHSPYNPETTEALQLLQQFSHQLTFSTLDAEQACAKCVPSVLLKTCRVIVQHIRKASFATTHNSETIPNVAQRMFTVFPMNQVGADRLHCLGVSSISRNYYPYYYSHSPSPSPPPIYFRSPSPSMSPYPSSSPSSSFSPYPSSSSSASPILPSVTPSQSIIVKPSTTSTSTATVSSTPTSAPKKSSTPTATPTQSLSSIPDFDPDEPPEFNLEVLRLKIERFLLTSPLVRRSDRITVTAELVNSSSRHFPFDSYPPYMWPGDWYYKREVVENEWTDVLDLTSVRAVSVERCGASNCAAKVDIRSNRFIRRELILKAIRQVKKELKVSKVFNINDRRFRIVRRGPKLFTVFVPFLSKYLQSQFSTN